MHFDEIHAKLKSFGDPERAELVRKIFETGPGHYGEGGMYSLACVFSDQGSGQRYSRGEVRLVKVTP